MEELDIARAPVDVILPCLDEAAAIPGVLASLPPGWRAVLVDNGSTDGSAAIAAELGATVVRAPDRGYGAAVDCGLSACTAEFVAVMDCDGSLDAAELLPLLALGWSMIFLLFPLFNRDRLRIGDMIAGTWVVHRVKAELGQDLVAWAATSQRARHVFTDAQLDLYGEYELQTLEQVLRAGHNDAIVTVAAAIRWKGAMQDDGDDYGFLSDYYAALCARLERGMMVGLRREDKYSQATRDRAA